MANLGAASVASNYWSTVSERPRNRAPNYTSDPTLGPDLDLSDEDQRPSLIRPKASNAESRWTAREKELFVEAFTKNGKVCNRINK